MTGGRWFAPALFAALALTLTFLTLPVVAIFVRSSPDELVATLDDPGVVDALWLSLRVTLAALAIVVVVGTPVAYLLARHRFRGRDTLDTLIDLPMVLPPAVAGLALLMAFGRTGIVGRVLADAGITVGFTTAAVVLAQVFVAVPFYVRAARAGFVRVDRVLEDADANLGAAPLRVFRAVTLPLARPNLVAGAVLAWARAVGEFGATILFAGNYPGRTQTMPLAVYGRFEAGDLPSALLLAAVLLGASLLVLLGVRLVGERGQEGVWR